ncbi:MAG: helix-turn-helix domain-containing protein [Acetivibrionales bacterium]|jgi:transposase
MLTNNSDIYELNRTTKSVSCYYRTKIVIMHLEGASTEEIAKTVGVGAKTVRRWIAVFRERGLKGLIESVKA